MHTENPNNGQYYGRESGRQRTRGVEVDIKGQVLPNLDVVINYAYTEAKVTKDEQKSNKQQRYRFNKAYSKRLVELQVR